MPAVFSGLQDQGDDVRAVAAAALLPVTDTLVEVMPQQIQAIIQCLWHTLLDLDDLTASTNSIMTLLSSLLAHPKVSADRWVALNVCFYFFGGGGGEAFPLQGTLNAYHALCVLPSSLATESLTELVPRLWPFLGHSISSVRKAALDMLHTLLVRCQVQVFAGSTPSLDFAGQKSANHGLHAPENVISMVAECSHVGTADFARCHETHLPEMSA